MTSPRGAGLAPATRTGPVRVRVRGGHSFPGNTWLVIHGLITGMVWGQLTPHHQGLSPEPQGRL